MRSISLFAAVAAALVVSAQPSAADSFFGFHDPHSAERAETLASARILTDSLRAEARQNIAYTAANGCRTLACPNFVLIGVGF
jgi:hypothetical protein